MGTHAYCEVCDAIQAVTIEPLDQPDTTGQFRGGGIAYINIVSITRLEPASMGSRVQDSIRTRLR